MMPGTRYKLIGECVVFIVKSPDAILKRVLTELKQVKKIKSKAKKNYYKYSSVKSKSKRGGKKRKKATAKQLRARKLFTMRVKRGDFRR